VRRPRNRGGVQLPNARQMTGLSDFIHVTDSAKARVLALKALKQGPMRRAFNLENGLGYSVREVIAQAERVTGHRVPVKLGEGALAAQHD